MSAADDRPYPNVTGVVERRVYVIDNKPVIDALVEKLGEVGAGALDIEPARLELHFIAPSDAPSPL